MYFQDILTQYHIQCCTFGIRHRASVGGIGLATRLVHLSLAHKLPFGNSLRYTIDYTHSIRSFPIYIGKLAASGYDDGVGVYLAFDAFPHFDRFEWN